jgi:GntR family transcriptional repressor for pyruvate dehydrogenase complex
VEDEMEVTSLREPKMADRVAAALRRMFIRGEIAEGTMLPPESDLMERFGVSRPTLREAFRVLESESLIVVKRGVRGGAQVTRPQTGTLARYAGFLLEYEQVTLREVWEARAALETPMVRQLAERRDRVALAELERSVDSEPQDFHAAIVRLSGNRTLQIVADMLHHVTEKACRALRTDAPGDQAGKRAARTHHAVLDLIKAGDAEKAGEIWHRHLDRAEDLQLTAAELATVVDLLG